MKILFCGSNLPDCFEGKVQHLSAAGNQFQNNLIHAMKSNHDVQTISYINYRVTYDRKEILECCERDNIEPVIQDKSPIESFLKFRKVLKENIKWADVVIVYNVLYAWFGVADIMRRKRKKSVAIIADFTNWKEQKSFLRKIYALITTKEFQRYSKVVMLSPGVEKYLSKNQEKIVINGCINWRKFEGIKPPVYDGIVNLVYTGGFSAVVGTDLMLQAFSQIKDQNIRLYISGQGGDQKDDVIKAAQNDSRIKYLGFLNRPDYYRLMESAHIFINPRNMNLEQNSANFPSKVLEYLAAGRSILSTKFIGYERYEKNMIFVESDSESICKGMKLAIDMVRRDCTKYYNINRKFAKMLDWEMMAHEFCN